MSEVATWVRPKPTAISHNSDTYKTILRRVHEALGELGYGGCRVVDLRLWLEGRGPFPRSLAVSHRLRGNLHWFILVSMLRAGVALPYLRSRGITFPYDLEMEVEFDGNSFP